MKFFRVFILILIMSLPHAAHAQSASVSAALFGPPKPAASSATPSAPAIEIPKDALGRETPRGTFSGFLSALGQGDYAKASGYMNLSSLP